MIFRCALFLALFFGRLLLAECPPQAMRMTVRPEANFLARDISPPMLDDTDLTVISSAGLEQKLLGLDTPQRRESLSLGINTVRSGFATKYSISNDHTNHSRHKVLDLTGSALVELDKQSSRLNTLPRQNNQQFAVKTARRKSGSVINYIISNDGVKSSTLTGVDITGVTSVKLTQQSSGLDTPQRQETQSFGIETSRRGSGSKTYNKISNDYTNPATLNAADMSGVFLAELEQQSSGLETPQRQEIQSSGVDVPIHRSSSLTNYTISRDDTNSLEVNGTALKDISASVELEEQLSRLDSSQLQVSQSSRIITVRHRSRSMTIHPTPDTNFSMVSHTDLTTALVEPEHEPVELKNLQRQAWQLAAFDSTKKQAIRSSTLDIVQNLKTRGAHINAQGQLGSASNNPVSALIQNIGSWQRQQSTRGKSFNAERETRSQGQGGPKKNAFDLAKCYGKLNRESFKRCLDKICHQPSKENINEVISKCKTMNKRLTRTVSQGFSKSHSSLKGVQQKIRKWNCVQTGLGIGKTKRVRRRAKEEQWSDFELECLRAHNEYRARHGVPALQLKRKLCDEAQAYANKLATNDPAVHGELPHSKYGENLSATRNYEVTGRSAVADWYNEISNYNFQTTYPKDDQQEYGHFTQVIWRETTYVGVGYATSANRVTYVVCHYEPEGNVRYKSTPAAEFHKNVPPPLYR